MSFDISAKHTNLGVLDSVLCLTYFLAFLCLGDTVICSTTLAQMRIVLMLLSGLN